MDALIQKIKLFDDVTLRDIAGPSIVSAVRESYQTDSQSVLAEIICMEHGTSILDKLRIRDNIIDVSSKSDIESLANAVGINFSNRIQTAHKLHTNCTHTSHKLHIKCTNHDVHFWCKVHRKCT